MPMVPRDFTRNVRDIVNDVIVDVETFLGIEDPGTPAVVFTQQPTVDPLTGTAGVTTYTATSGALSDGSVPTRSWLQGGTALSTGLTFSPASGVSGQVVYQEFGPNGVVSNAIAVTVNGAVVPQPGMEAVIDPPVNYERSLYQFTKQGTVITFDPTNTYFGAGVYWPGRMIHRPTANYPNRHLSYYGGDHVPSRGGLFMSVCMADSDNPAEWVWRTFADARDNTNWLADFSGLPSTAYIYRSESMDSLETPSVTQDDDGTWVAFMSVKSGALNARGQSTVRLISPNGVTGWTTDRQSILRVSTQDAIGDGDITYAPVGRNPFNDVINPATGQKWKWITYSLVGGTARSTAAMWGFENLKTDYPTLITTLNKTGGRASPPGGGVGNPYTFASINMDVQSAVVTRQGVSVLCTALTRGSGGQTNSSLGGLYYILLAHDGKTIIGKPIPAVSAGATGSDDARAVERGEVSIVRNQAALIYTGINANSYGSGMLATSPWRNPANVWFDPLVPALPTTGITTRSYNFKGVSALPTGLELITAGTTPPVPTFDANGMSVTVDGTQAIKSEAQFFDSVGFNPATTEYVDLWIEDWITTSAGAYRVPYIGFTTQKALAAAQTDAVYLFNNNNSSRLYYRSLIGGAEPRAAQISEYYWGVGFGTTVANYAASKKRLGVRWMLSTNQLFVLGEGGVEMEEMLTSLGNYAAGFTRSEQLYPFFGFAGTSTEATTERVGRFTVNIK